MSLKRQLLDQTMKRENKSLAKVYLLNTAFSRVLVLLDADTMTPLIVFCFCFIFFK